MTLGGDHAVQTRAQYQRGTAFALHEARFDPQPDQSLDIPDVAASLEKSAHDSILDRRRQAGDGALAARVRRMGYQQMGEARIRHALDQVESELDAACLTLALQFGMCRSDAFRSAEFRQQVAGAVDAVDGQVGIELERAPGH